MIETLMKQIATDLICVYLLHLCNQQLYQNKKPMMPGIASSAEVFTVDKLMSAHLQGD